MGDSRNRTDLEFKKFNGDGSINVVTKSEAVIIDDYSTANITYFCYAECGSATSDAVWKIKIIDETGDYPVFKWADSNSDYDNVADDRTTLNYG